MNSQQSLFPEETDLTVCPKCKQALDVGGGLMNYCHVCQVHYRKDFGKCEIDPEVREWGAGTSVDCRVRMCPQL